MPLLLALSAWGQAAPKPPVLTKQVPPEYPAAQLDGGVGADVVLQIDIGADGKVMKVVVTQSAGEDFDNAAVTAAQQLEFQPAEYDGKPIPVRIQYTSHFFAPVPEVVEPPPDAGPANVVNFSGTLSAAGTREPIAGAQEHGEVALLQRRAGRYARIFLRARPGGDFIAGVGQDQPPVRVSLRQ